MAENESKLVLHSASDLPDVAMNKDEEKPGVEMGTDWGSAPETKDEIKRISAATLHSTADETSDISIEKRCNAPSSPSKEAAATHGRMAEEPQFGEMNRDIQKVITEIVCQPKLKKEMTMEEENTVRFGYNSMNVHIKTVVLTFLLRRYMVYYINNTIFKSLSVNPDPGGDHR